MNCSEGTQSQRQKSVIFSWDDYEFRVPKNMPQPELLATFLRKPITRFLIPPAAENYARANELDVEEILPTVGGARYFYQAKRIAKHVCPGMRTALRNGTRSGRS